MLMLSFMLFQDAYNLHDIPVEEDSRQRQVWMSSERDQNNGYDDHEILTIKDPPFDFEEYSISKQYEDDEPSPSFYIESYYAPPSVIELDESWHSDYKMNERGRTKRRSRSRSKRTRS